MRVDRRCRTKTSPSTRSENPSAPQGGIGLTLKRALVGALLASSRSALAAPSAAEALAPPFREPKPCAIVPWRFEAPPVLPCGVEQELLTGERQLDEAMRSATSKVVTVPRTWQMWLGQGTIPDKGKNLGAWRAVPELALPLNSFEVISPALRPEDLQELEAVTAALVASGARTDADLAVHVHVAHASLSGRQLRDLILLWDAQHDMVLALGHSTLRQRQYYNKRLEAAFIAQLQAMPNPSKADIYAAYEDTHDPLRHLATPGHGLRYYSLNLSYLLKGETIEFRIFQYPDGPNATQVRAFVDLSLALTRLARDGDAGCLTNLPLDPSESSDVQTFLHAVGLGGDRFAASRTALTANARRDRGFMLFDGELRRAAMDAAVGVAAGVFGSRRPNTVVGALAQSAAWVCGVRLVGLGLEAAGLSSYTYTFAIRDHEPSLFAGRLFVAGMQRWMARRADVFSHRQTSNRLLQEPAQ